MKRKKKKEKEKFWKQEERSVFQGIAHSLIGIFIGPTSYQILFSYYKVSK